MTAPHSSLHFFQRVQIKAEVLSNIFLNERKTNPLLLMLRKKNIKTYLAGTLKALN